MRASVAALGIGVLVFAHPPRVPLKALDQGRGGPVRSQGPVATTDSPATADKGTRLEDVTWPEAEALLRPETVVVVPLGVAAQEHGPHLKLRNDLTLVEYLTSRVVAAAPIVAAPPLTYHYDPAFVEYPGSTSLSLATARDLTSDVARSLARYGPRRFYVLNVGTRSARALDASARALAGEGILLRYTDIDARLQQASRNVRQQEGGRHADEIETSMMLYVAPSAVNMKKAVKDFFPEPARSGAATAALRLTRQPGGTGTYSPTGIFGDPTLATAEEGRAVVEALVSAVVQDLADLREAPLPSAAPPQPPARPVAAGPPGERVAAPDRCTPGDERTIRSIGDAFAAHWANGDAMSLGGLWSREGDLVHPDGTIERGAQVITQNRMQLFLQRQYRGTRHPLTLGIIRCLTADVGVADGKWELRGVSDANGQPVPTMEGLCTLVVKKAAERWAIEAYRYTIKPPPPGTVPPTLLQRPGWPVIK